MQMKTLLWFACAQTHPLPRVEIERLFLLRGVMNIKDWEHMKISCVIFFSSPSSPLHTSEERIWRIYCSESLKYSWGELGSVLQARQTKLELSYHHRWLSPNHWRSKWNLIFFYLFWLHLFPLWFMFGCFISLRTQTGRSHTCWGAWITNVESIAGMSVPRWWISGDISEQKSPKTQWTTGESFTHQYGDNAQNYASHVVFQFPVGQCSVQAVEGVPGCQLQENKQHKELKGRVLLWDRTVVETQRKTEHFQAKPHHRSPEGGLQSGKDVFIDTTALSENSKKKYHPHP